MLNKEIIYVLNQWNFWQKLPNLGVERPLYVDLLYKQHNLKEVSVISGVRRSGKSTILLQTLKRLIDSGTAKENILYVNFEDPSFAQNLNLQFLLQILDAYKEEFAPQGKIFIALDEVSQISQWEKFVRGIYDKEDNIKFYITDSSSRLLSPEYGKTLTGRTLTNIIYPLSFAEFLRFQNLSVTCADSQSPELRHIFKDYLQYGGFPQVALTSDVDNKIKILKEYFFAIIEKDITQRYHIRDVKQLKEFCLLVISNNTQLFSGYAAGRALSLSQPTANKFLNYLQEVYLFWAALFFSYSFRQQQTRAKKIYSIDTGLYNAVSFKFSENIGKVFENAVFLSLRRLGQEVFYWQGKQEVDFVVREGIKIKRLINVCYDLHNDNRVREVNGLKEAMKKFNIKEAEIITLGVEEKIEVAEGVIRVKDFLDEVSLCN